MPEKLGPRKPADLEQAKRNRAAVQALVARRLPALAKATERAAREGAPVRRTARSR
jgi:hypothetical protein